MPRRIFIVGQRGQVARALVRAYAARGDVVATAGRASIDISDQAVIGSAISRFEPELVINAAAYTAVDQAEEEVERAFAVNREGARHVAAAAHMAAAPVIHLSTDYVFDGAKTTPYLETDQTAPIGVYGRSKLEGEAAVAVEASEHLILRTSWVCSPDGSNFVKTMLRLAAQGDEIGVVDDQWGAPTFAADLAAAIALIGERLLSTRNRAELSGIYHATGSGMTTWCRFARAIMQESETRGGPACRVRAIQTSEYPTRARRPQNSRLDCSKLDRVFGIRLPPWETSLRACLDQLLSVPQGTAA